MFTEQRMNDLEERLLQLAKLADHPIAPGELIFDHQPAPHVARAKKTNHSAIYIFYHDLEILKVGYAGTGSNPRFQLQHYSFNTPSTLARSLRSRSYQACREVNDEGLEIWMKTNLGRLDITLPKETPLAIGHLMESFLLCLLEPRFEGHLKRNISDEV